MVSVTVRTTMSLIANKWFINMFAYNSEWTIDHLVRKSINTGWIQFRLYWFILPLVLISCRCSLLSAFYFSAFLFINWSYVVTHYIRIMCCYDMQLVLCSWFGLWVTHYFALPWLSILGTTLWLELDPNYFWIWC